MPSTSAFSATAALIGDPARANMLTSLMDGRALTATELACAAGITPQTASGHLARLTEAGLLAVTRQGRHRYHRLASAAIAQMLESIMSVAAEREAGPGGGPGKAIVVGPRDAALRRARTCYDHLAGRLAVAIADRLVERAHIELSADGGMLTERGAIFLQALGVDLEDRPARGSGASLDACFAGPAWTGASAGRTSPASSGRPFAAHVSRKAGCAESIAPAPSR